MTPDLTYLALTAMLTGALWIPYVVSQVMTNGFLTRENYSTLRNPRCHLCGITAVAQPRALQCGGIVEASLRAGNNCAS